MQLKNLWLLLLALPLCGAVQAKQPLLRFDAPTVELGDVKAAGGKRMVEFRYTNLSEKPVSIVTVHARCGCVVPSYAKAPLAPGRSAVVRVAFDPVTLTGPRAESLTVVADNGDYRKYSTLTVRATVVRPQ